MRIIHLYFLLVIFLFSTEYVSAAPVSETLIGKMTVSKNNTIDAKSRSELAIIAKKIKKLRKSGSVRIVGTAPTASSQDDFISKSVFVARNAESHLRKLLPQSFQTYVTVAKFENLDPDGKTAVAVYLYPHELRPEGARFVSTDIDNTMPSSTSDSAQHPIENALQGASSQTTESGLLSQQQHDDGDQNRKNTRDRIQVETEDAAKAEELVNKAKARAAKKARQLETQ